MALALVGRRPIRNLFDSKYYMCEIGKDTIYQIHPQDTGYGFVGFDDVETCTKMYIEHIVNSFKDNSTKLTNFNPEFQPACYLAPDKPAHYVVFFHNNYLLVNNYEDKKAIMQWLLDKGTIVF